MCSWYYDHFGVYSQRTNVGGEPSDVAAADGVMERLLQEFPNHNWLEHKISWLKTASCKSAESEKADDNSSPKKDEEQSNITCQIKDIVASDSGDIKTRSAGMSIETSSESVAVAELSCRKKGDIGNTSMGMIAKECDRDLTKRSINTSYDNVAKFKIVSVYSVDKNTFVNDVQDSSDNKDFVVCNIRDKSTNALKNDDDGGGDKNDDDDDDDDEDDDDDDEVDDNDDDDDIAENTLVISEDNPEENALGSVDARERNEECDEILTKSDGEIIQCSVLLTRSDYLSNFDSGQSRCIEKTDDMNGVANNNQRQESVAIFTHGCFNAERDVEKATRDRETPNVLTSVLTACEPKEDVQVPSTPCPTDEGYDDTEVPESDLLFLPMDNSIAVVANSKAPIFEHDKTEQGSHSMGDFTFDRIIEQNSPLARKQGDIQCPKRDPLVGKAQTRNMEGNPNENVYQKIENADASITSQKSLALLALDLINSRDESQASKSEPPKLLPSSAKASVDNHKSKGTPVVTITLSDTEACEDTERNSDLPGLATSAETCTDHEEYIDSAAASINLEGPVDLSKVDKIAVDLSVSTDVTTPTTFTSAGVEQSRCYNPKLVCPNTQRNITVHTQKQFHVSNSPIGAVKKQSPVHSSQIAYQPKTSIFNGSQTTSGSYMQQPVRDGQASMSPLPFSNAFNRAIKRGPSMGNYNMELQSKMPRRETIPLRATQLPVNHRVNNGFILGSPKQLSRFPWGVLGAKRDMSALHDEFQKTYAELMVENDMPRNLKKERLHFNNSSYHKGIAMSGRAMASHKEMVWIKPQLNNGHCERNNNTNINYRSPGSVFSRTRPDSQTGQKTIDRGLPQSCNHAIQSIDELVYGKRNNFTHDVNASCSADQTKHPPKETFLSYGPQASADHMHGLNGTIVCENEMEMPSVAETPSSQEVQGEPPKPPPAHSNAVRYRTWIPQVGENLSFKSSQPASAMMPCSSIRPKHSVTTTGKPDSYKNSRPENMSMSRPTFMHMNKPRPIYPNAHLPKRNESSWSVTPVGPPPTLYNQAYFQKTPGVNRNSIADYERIYEETLFGVPDQPKRNYHQMNLDNISPQHESGFKSLHPPPPYEHAIMADKREAEMLPPNLIPVGYNKQKPNLNQSREHLKNMTMQSVGMLSVPNSFNGCSANPYTQAYHDCLPKVMPRTVKPDQYSSVNPEMSTPSQFVPQNQRFEKPNAYTSHQQMIRHSQRGMSNMGQGVRNNMYPIQPRMSQMPQVARPTAQWPHQVKQVHKENTVARFPVPNQHLQGPLTAGQASLRHCNDVQSRRCAVCPGPAEFLCGRCQNIWYCTKHCQTEDWRLRHRLVCSV